MTEFRDVLERELERLTPPRLLPERLARRRDRKRRSQRIAAGIVAVVVSLLAIGGLIEAFSGKDRTADRTPDVVHADLSFVDVETGGARPLPPAITGIPRVANIQVSPDGSMLAFEGAETRTSPRHIYLSGIDGSNIKPITDDNPVDASFPSWSADGTRVVFDGATGEGGAIFVVDIATGATYRLGDPEPTSPIVARRPAFINDDQFIILSVEGGGSIQQWMVPATGAPLGSVMLDDAAFASQSPDGTQLAYRRAEDAGPLPALGGIFVAGAFGTEPRALTVRGPADVVSWPRASELNASAPLWSPDGSRLVTVDPFSGPERPREVQVIDVSSGEATTIGFGLDASWFNDETLIVRAYEASSATVPSPSASETPSPDVERVGFLGLAPESSQPSLPPSGGLVISFQYFCCPGRSMYVYEDGRIIWSEVNIVSQGAKGYFPLPPQGANDDETGYLEQRLTPRGLELLRSALVSSGLFDEDHSFVKKTEELTIGLRRGDQTIELHAAKADDPYRATEEQAREISRITDLLNAPESLLPDDAWADRTIRAFVPSRYFVEMGFYSNGSVTPDDPSELPPPADDLLRSADVVTSSSTCQVVTEAEARRITHELRDAFGGPTILLPIGGPFGVPVTFRSALPHQIHCPT